MNAVPKSGSSTISPHTRPVTTATGASVVTCSIVSNRRSSTAAVKMMTASLANSEGCTLMPPSASHRRVPFTGGRKKTTTRAATHTPSAVQITTGCFKLL